MSSFFGINIALSAIRAQQYAMDVTGHNIANANTPGYRRQTPILAATQPIEGLLGTLGVGLPQLGTGVIVHSVQRAQTQFLDAQIRLSSQLSGAWNARNTALGQLEPMLAEPGENGLSATLNQFWNSWQDLATNPESMSSRVAVVESGVAVAERIRTLYLNIRNLQTDTDHRVVSNVEDINRIAQQIAKLNEQITEPAESINLPNDLLDQREVLLEELSKIVGVEVHGDGGAEMIVSLGGKILVQGNQVCTLDVTKTPTGWSRPVWEADGSEVLVTEGSLKALMDVRDGIAEDYIGSLNEITEAIVTRVNALHTSGSTLSGNPGEAFFTPGSTAYDITVSSNLITNPSDVVAAATGGGPRDNSIANAISAVRDEALIDGRTVGEAYTALVSKIGAHAAEAQNRTEVYDISLNQRRSQRESVVGVSIDEEMVNMVKFQHGYNAAARIMTVLDEMIDTVINRMGAGGR